MEFILNEWNGFADAFHVRILRCENGFSYRGKMMAAAKASAGVLNEVPASYRPDALPISVVYSSARNAMK